MARRIRSCEVPYGSIESEFTVVPFPPTRTKELIRLRLQTIAKSIEQYSNQLESMFIDEMFPRKPEEALDQDVARPSAWLTKAKMVVQGDKKVEPFEFKAAVSRLSSLT